MSDWSRREQRIQTICLIVIASISTAVALWWLSPVLIPLVLALFLTWTLSPVVDFLILRGRFPRPLAMFTTFLLGAAMIFALWLVMSTSVGEMAANSERYSNQTRLLLYDVASHLGLDPSEDRPQDSFAVHLPTEEIRKFVGELIKQILSVLSYSLLVAIFLFFMLIGKQPSAGFGDEVEHSIRRYLLVKMLISIVVGVAHGIVLATVGVQPAVVFALLTFLLNFIPSVGPLISVLLPLPVLPLVPGLTGAGIAVVVLVPLVINFWSGNIAEPRLMGLSLRLHPVTLLAGLIFFGMIWGIAGMFLAVPILAVLRISLARNEASAPFADAMSGDLASLAVYGHSPSEE
ncbi:MAG: AI-2E family transporter [Planctomycetota bacterium]